MLSAVVCAIALVQPRALRLAALPRTTSIAAVVSAPVRCDVLLRELFLEQPEVDAAAVAAACSDDVEWNDMDLREPIKGRAAVQDLLESKFPTGSKLIVERLSDGTASGGFTWHREAVGEEGTGRRGVTYVELDVAGQIVYVQEGAEPLFKLDKILEAVLQATNKAVKEGVADDGAAPKPRPSYPKANPTTASGIVKYLWEVAYPGGATPTEALAFFADEILYEDFNYYEPFVGFGAVSEYISLLDAFPNFVFIPERISEGDRACCLTWRCEVNGEAGPSGISFNEVNAQGKISFARDIPAPSIKPPPLTALAKITSPKLRVLTPRPPTLQGGTAAASAASASVATTTPAAAEAAAVEYPSALTTLTSRPVRMALLLTYLAFNVYVVGFSPGEVSFSADSADNQLIASALAEPASLNTLFFVIFNALGVLPAVNLALLLPGSRGQKPLPTAPFVGASFALGFGAVGPYLALRQPRPEPIARSQLGFFSRYVTESKVGECSLLMHLLIAVDRG